MCIFSFKYNELGKQFKENPMLLVTEHSHLLSKILIKSLLNGCTKSTGTWCMMDVHKRSISWSPYYNLNLSKMLFYQKLYFWWYDSLLSYGWFWYISLQQGYYIFASAFLPSSFLAFWADSNINWQWQEFMELKTCLVNSQKSIKGDQHRFH